MSRKKTINNIIPRNVAERAARLKSWWKSKGWNKVEFAHRMKIWPQNVNKYFTGVLDPTNLVDQLMKENCDVMWIIEGKTGKLPLSHGIIAEPTVIYGKKKSDHSDKKNRQNRERLNRLAELLESGADRTDREMLDMLIKRMEEKQRKK
jgi:hypothetical protein